VELIHGAFSRILSSLLIFFFGSGNADKNSGDVAWFAYVDGADSRRMILSDLQERQRRSSGPYIDPPVVL
jgi:hypothetical protein